MNKQNNLSTENTYIPALRIALHPTFAELLFRSLMNLPCPLAPSCR